MNDKEMQNANKVSSGIVLLQNVPHKNSRTYCNENYNTSSSFAKEVVSLLKSTNDKRNNTVLLPTSQPEKTSSYHYLMI